MNKVFKVIAVLFVSVTITLDFFSSAKADEVIASTAASANCAAEVPKHRHEYKGLKQVALYISIPSSYEEALRCHGKEQDCLEQTQGSRVRNDSKRRQAYIQDLINTYQQYPKALSRENLTKLFSERIKERIFPFVQRDELCRIPEIKIVSRQDYEAVFKEEDTYLIVANINVQSWKTSPPITIVQSRGVRIGGDECDYSCKYSAVEPLAIPLEMSDQAIKELVSGHVNRVVALDGNPLSK